MQSVRYEEMLPRELAAARAAAPLAYFPIGSLEYHGFHLPFGFDAMHAHAYCLQEPGALHAIGADAVDATAAAGRERFETCVAELVRRVQAGLQGL